MKKDEKALIDLFKAICCNCYYYKPASLIKPFNETLHYRLDFENQLQRGVEIENVLVEKIFKLNETKALHRLDGSYYNGVYNIREAFTFQRWYSLAGYFKEFQICSNKKFKAKDIHIGSSEIFTGRYRCITQPRIDTCCIDSIIDDTIIDIKTDTNTSSLKKYVRQVFVQAVQYTSFLCTAKQYNPFLDDHNIEMIERPINNIGIYFWRTNEYFKYSIRDILREEEFDRLVEIYTLLQPLYGCDLRHLAKKYLFAGLP